MLFCSLNDPRTRAVARLSRFFFFFLLHSLAFCFSRFANHRHSAAVLLERRSFPVFFLNFFFLHLERACILGRLGSSFSANYAFLAKRSSVRRRFWIAPETPLAEALKNTPGRCCYARVYKSLSYIKKITAQAFLYRWLTSDA